MLFSATMHLVCVCVCVCVCVNSLDEGETIMRTLTDYWVVCRKSGHRRFFVVLTQKNSNFAEING